MYTPLSCIVHIPVRNDHFPESVFFSCGGGGVGAAERLLLRLKTSPRGRRCGKEGDKESAGAARPRPGNVDWLLGAATAGAGQ